MSPSDDPDTGNTEPRPATTLTLVIVLLIIGFGPLVLKSLL